jgi:methylase of polypeptide subunit release factors
MFDLIVTNPPYIRPETHRDLVHTSVNEFEPHQALYIQDENYDAWFDEFFQEIQQHLKGHFFMEGHELELDKQAKQLTRLGFKNVVILNDLTATKRFLSATFGI